MTIINSISPQNKSALANYLEVSGTQTKAKIFASEIEDIAIEQIKTLCDMPIFKNVPIRIMPDVSACKNCVVGFTAKMDPENIKYLPPFIIGNDIGCGVLLIKTDNKVNDVDFAEIDKFIKNELSGNKKIRPQLSENLKQDILNSGFLAEQEKQNVFNQAGTLGNGNHFIEIDRDEENNLYLAIHTGSRQFGSYIREYFEKLYNENKSSSDITYAQAVSLAQEYAKNNRQNIATMILNRFKMNPTMQFDCPHNYISDNGIVHKGSIDASLGQPVLIPLNMRDGMILAKGKGNADWNYSAPHGSGRKMSRTDARKNIDLNEYVDSMRGIYSSCVGRKSVDESPQAYKNSNEILELVSQTADIETIIHPIYNFKQTRH